MPHDHGHAGDTDDVVVDQRLLTWLWPIVVGLGVLVVVAMAVLWPLGDDDVDDPLLLDADPVPADVVDDQLLTCSTGVGECRWIDFVMTGGPYEGERASVERRGALDRMVEIADAAALYERTATPKRTR